MIRAILVLVLSIGAPLLCLSIDGIDAAPSHSPTHQHHRAELTLLEMSPENGTCIDAAPLPISHQPGIRFSGEVAVWENTFEFGEPHALAVQPLPFTPDTARAWLQVYRL